jgi:hypothetical protein
MSKKNIDGNHVGTGGMITAIWGPPLWTYLHTISFYYPWEPSEKQKKDYFLQIKLLSSTLPCQICKNNYKKNIKKKHLLLNKSVFKNRYTFSKWVYDLHNEVNKHLGKSISMSYDEVQKRYDSFRANCTVFTNKKGCTTPKKGYMKKKIMMRIVPKSKKCETFCESVACKGR